MLISNLLTNNRHFISIRTERMDGFMIETIFDQTVSDGFYGKDTLDSTPLCTLTKFDLL